MNPLSTLRQLVWESRYRAPESGEQTPEETFARVARALAMPEKSHQTPWQHEFMSLMADTRFLPGGRILANAGRRGAGSLANCFVAGTLQDSRLSVNSILRECALTLQAGGGVGIDFSPLRPRGGAAVHPGKSGCGPVACLATWNDMSETLMRAHPRRGAMMGVLDCNHPDILEFIHAKRQPGALQHFNLSVLISDAFMQTLARDGDWPLVFAGRVVDTVPAANLWQAMLENNLQGGEPGILFIDRINLTNRLRYREVIRATNPCGELPLPPYGSCVLGSLVLPAFVEQPFTPRARINFTQLQRDTRTAVRLLDNTLEVARLPLAQQRTVARETRRLGLGITGLADMFIMLGQAYNSTAARQTATEVAAALRDAAYAASAQLGVEKGPFPGFTTAWLDSDLCAALPSGLATRIRNHGIRNSHLTAIAPTGSISLLAGNVSSGIEPVFDWSYSRSLSTAAGLQTIQVTDYAWQYQRDLGLAGDTGDRNGANASPDLSGQCDRAGAFVRLSEVSAEDQLRMVAVLQPYIDSAISKTVWLPPATRITDIDRLFQRAYETGIKGIATYPATNVRGAVLQSGAESCKRAHDNCPSS